MEMWWKGVGCETEKRCRRMETLLLPGGRQLLFELRLEMLSGGQLRSASLSSALYPASLHQNDPILLGSAGGSLPSRCTAARH